MELASLLPLLTGILLLAWLFVKYWEDYYLYWKKRGIPYKPGKYPYGSSKGYTQEVEFQGEFQEQMYKEFKTKPYFGFFIGTIPTLVVRDPEILRLVLAKEFSHFRDRQGLKMDEDDHLSHHLFNLEGDKWRALRVKMSPVFTSGKLKGMFPLFIKCSEALNKLLLSKIDSEIDAKDLAGRFSTDIICSCAFGLEVDSLNDSENSFRKIGKKFMELNFSFKTKLILKLRKYVPWFHETPFPKFTPPEAEAFMIKTIQDTVEHREKTGHKRNDFIDLLMLLRSKGVINEDLIENDLNNHNIEPVELTFELMTAQCFVFFIAGFETSSSVQSFCLYELALHQEVQEKLHKEIEETIEKHGGVTYKAIQEMTYLDMVVSETMRKYPTLIQLARRCTNTLVLPDGTTIEKGMRILIPLWSLHHDPEHFPKPDVFDPERFSPENRSSIHQFAYMPFGEGPRMCIGERFGQLQTKMGIITIIRKYKVDKSEKTVIPLEFDGISPVLLRTKGPIILKLTKRS